MSRKPTNTPSRIARRDLLKSASALVLPYLIPGSVLGASAPSRRLTVGCIGTGNQGIQDLRDFLRNRDVQVLAVADVNTGSHGYRDAKQFLGREPGRKTVDAFYAKEKRSGKYKGCAAYNDFREIIHRGDIDVVVISTPDHWHGAMVVAAAKAGKDIFCQKPLSLTIRQGQKMVEAVRQYKRILQTGSQYRSGPAVRHGCELVLNGRIGQVKTIRTFLAKNNFVGPGPGWKPMPVPEGFDYPMWLGPAPDAPYHVDRCLYRYRFIFDYSGGQMTNFGAHANDVAQWGNGPSLTGPVEFEPIAVEWPPRGSLFNTAVSSHFRARYANGVELICQTDERGCCTRFEGTEGWVEIAIDRLTTHPESLRDSKIGPDEIHLPVSVAGRTVNHYSHYRPDHVRNFLDAVLAGKDPIEPVEVGHRTASLCHLGNIALRLGRKLQWDPQKEQFVDDAEADKMLDQPMRSPWQI